MKTYLIQYHSKRTQQTKRMTKIARCLSELCQQIEEEFENMEISILASERIECESCNKNLTLADLEKTPERHICGRCAWNGF